jgi:hypothetical protein
LLGWLLLRLLLLLGLLVLLLLHIQLGLLFCRVGGRGTTGRAR